MACSWSGDRPSDSLPDRAYPNPRSLASCGFQIGPIVLAEAIYAIPEYVHLRSHPHSPQACVPACPHARVPVVCCDACTWQYRCCAPWPVKCGAARCSLCRAICAAVLLRANPNLLTHAMARDPDTSRVLRGDESKSCGLTSCGGLASRGARGEHPSRRGDDESASHVWSLLAVIGPPCRLHLPSVCWPSGPSVCLPCLKVQRSSARWVQHGGGGHDGGTTCHQHRRERAGGGNAGSLPKSAESWMPKVSACRLHGPAVAILCPVRRWAGVRVAVSKRVQLSLAGRAWRCWASSSGQECRTVRGQGVGRQDRGGYILKRDIRLQY